MADDVLKVVDVRKRYAPFFDVELTLSDGTKHVVSPIDKWEVGNKAEHFEDKSFREMVVRGIRKVTEIEHPYIKPPYRTSDEMCGDMKVKKQ